MITVEFFEDDEKITGFSISGHAEDAAYGESLICAAISAISQTTINGLIEIAKAKFKDFRIENGNIFLTMDQNDDKKNEFAAEVLMKNLKLGTQSLAYEAPKDIRIIHKNYI